MLALVVCPGVRVHLHRDYLETLEPAWYLEENHRILIFPSLTRKAPLLLDLEGVYFNRVSGYVLIFDDTSLTTLCEFDSKADVHPSFFELN